MHSRTHLNGPWILGISGSHNGAACLIKGSELVVAVQEERLTGIKRYPVQGAQPSLSTRYCLEYAGITPRELDLIVLSSQSSVTAPENDISRNTFLQISDLNTPVVRISHHMGHAISAYCASGFESSAVLVIDGMGSPVGDLSADEQATVKDQVTRGSESISLYLVQDRSIVALEKHLVAEGAWLISRGKAMPFFRTIGGMYSAVARQIFGKAMEAGKVMGLAPYGRPTIAREEFFSLENGTFLFHDRVPEQFEHGRRWPDLAPLYEDLASSVQIALEDAVLYLVRRLFELSQSPALCYAGGVALNGVANERIARESQFSSMFIPPAAEDSGVAIGAAYYGLWQITGELHTRQLLSDSPGRTYSNSAISKTIASIPMVYVPEIEKVADKTADMLCEGQIIGWHQGGSELGPRALGQRSILCDPRLKNGKEVLNDGIKFRESFRPFAPAVLADHAREWFMFDETPPSSPFMLRVCRFRENLKEMVPAVVHVDGTGRVQTVSSDANPALYQLIYKFYERTGVPMLLNTSFNVAGEPLVETPEDAIWCFLATAMHACVIGESMVLKKPEFRSILDLRPQRTCTPPERDHSGRDKINYTIVATPWGRTCRRISDHFVSVLQLVDGTSDGWHLWRQVCIRKEVSQTSFICTLANLRRAGLIQLIR
jgi:carbamoyltransferase